MITQQCPEPTPGAKRSGRSVPPALVARGALLIFLSVLAWGAKEAAAGEHSFVAADAIDLQGILPPPPEEGSLADLADRDVVLMLARQRSEAQIAAAVADEQLGPMEWVAEVLGPAWNARWLPRTAELLERVRADFSPYAHVSGHADRPRPVARDAAVAPVVEHGPQSYPSARTAATAIWAAIAAELVPEHAAALDLAARNSAWLRVIAGAHYPTDIVAGRMVAEVFLEHLRASTAFREGMRAAAEELAAGPGIAVPASPKSR